MPQKIRSSTLEYRSNRLKLPARKKPYYVRIARGMWLGYRRIKTAGTWVARVIANGNDWTKKVGAADDNDEANGKDILTSSQAQDAAKKIARDGKLDGGDTVKAALDRYEDDLKGRGGDVNNVARARLHLTDKLAKKRLGSLTTRLGCFRHRTA
jgi:hypothetical protein